MTPLGFVSPDDDDDPRIVGVGQADAQPGESDSGPQTIANVVHVHVERDRGALVLAAALALVALALRR